MTKADRYDEGKPQHHWLDTWPVALEKVARVFMYGAKKYAAYNYKKGAPASESYNCARRHMLKYFNGEFLDEESGEPHLAHAAWNLLRLLDEHYQEPEGFEDDRPHNTRS